MSQGRSTEPLLRELRGSLASLRAAAEALELAAAPVPGAPGRELLAVLTVEAARSTALVERLAEQLLPQLGAGEAVWALPGALESLVARAQAELDLALVPGAVVAEARSTVAAGPLEDALLAALGRLRRDFAVQRAEVAARFHEQLLLLDVSWRASEPELWRLREEHADLLAASGPDQPGLRAVVQAAGGEAWLAFDRATDAAALRVLLPLAG